MIQNIGNRVAYFEHRKAQPAGFFIRTDATLVCDFADAPDGRQRAVERTHNLAQRDFVGGARQIVTAVRAQPAVEKTGILEREQDLLKKLDRYLLAFGDLADLYNVLFGISRGQVDQSLDSVFAALGEFHWIECLLK